MTQPTTQSWENRYRPETLEDTALSPELRQRFERYLSHGLPRHLILHGPPGTGKTSVAQIIATKLYHSQGMSVMRVKAGESGDVEHVREKVVGGFMRSMLSPKKLLFFEEASGLSPQAQEALRVPLEEFEHVCRVMFLTNKVEKFDPAVRSRCEIVEVGLPPLDERTRVLERILTAEGITAAPADVQGFVSGHFAGASEDDPRDMRTLLSAAEHSVETHGELHIEPPSDSGWGDVWPKRVEGNQLLFDLAEQFRRHLVLPAGGYPAVALWTLFAWTAEAYALSPILAIVSPTMESGKSTLLDMLEFLCPGIRGTSLLHVAHLTPASLHHLGGLMGGDQHPEEIPPAPTPPTAVLLADEVDAWMKAGDLTRAALDGGYSRSQAFKLLAKGRYSTWYPKCLCFIERDTFQLPATVRSRSIVIRMQKVLVGPEEFRLDQPHPELAELKRKAARWALDHWFQLRDADPPLPGELVGRARQSWRIFFSIASVAGGAWPKLVEETWRALSKRKGETREQAVELILDIHTVFESDSSRPDRLPTAVLLESLLAMEDRPWRGMGLTVHKLSRMLRPFEIGPTALWATKGGGEKGTRQGYFRRDFQEVFKVYVTPPAAPTPTTRA